MHAQREIKHRPLNCMSSMEIIFLIFVLHLGGLCCIEADPLTVTGVVGGHVTITCSHSFASSNTKYLCKEKCEDEDVLIKGETKPAFSKGRYRIWDGGNIFNVTITELKVTDTGMYRCGIDRFGLDTYTVVHLEVTHATKTRHAPPVKDTTTANVIAAGHKRNPGDKIIQSSSPEAEFINTSSSDKLVYIGASLGVGVLALAFVLLVFIRKRNRQNTTASSVKNQKTVYAMSNQHRDAHCDITTYDNLPAGGRSNTTNTSSAVQQQVTSRDADDIYSNVAESTPDSLFYSTVTFNTDTDHGSLTSRKESVMYATITYNDSRGSDDETKAYHFHSV